MELDEQYLMIDSRKRDLVAYPNANSYSVYLMNPLRDIVKVDVAMCSMNLVTNTNLYGILDIDQFRSKFGLLDGKSNLVSNVTVTPDMFNMTACFPVQSQLNVLYQEGGNYRQTVMFQQPIESLNKLTIRWIDRLNNLIAFGSTENQILLRIYTIRKPPPAERESELPPPVQITQGRWPEVIVVLMVVLLLLVII